MGDLGPSPLTETNSLYINGTIDRWSFEASYLSYAEDEGHTDFPY